MLVPTSELSLYRSRVAMVDGGFDPLHAGHIDYFEEAAKLGLPVLCNVSSDEWVARKHRPLLRQAERGRILDALRPIALTHLASGTTAEVLRELQPRYYVKGADWSGRLPQDEVRVCAQHGVEVVFLDTVTASSTEILERHRSELGDERRSSQ